MHICILDSLEIEDDDDHMSIEGLLKTLGHTCETHFIEKATAVQKVRSLVLSKKFDVFFNLCDGPWDYPSAGIEVVQVLEHYNVPFTGADSYFYDPTREQMKMACDLNRIKFPGYIIVTDLADLHLAVKNLQFPLIVKHFQSYGSIGLHKKSRVETYDELIEQSTIMLKEYGEILIEEFIDGKEFTVLVVENPNNPLDPIVYDPIGFTFSTDEGNKAFKHYEMKWVDYNQMSEKCVEDKSVSNKLKDISKKIFLGLKGTSYGRCDFRMAENGDLFFLEINPLCGMFYGEKAPGSADFILKHDKKGHLGFVDLIIRSAFNRVKKTEKWKIMFSEPAGFSIYANELIEEGECIIDIDNNQSEANLQFFSTKPNIVELDYFLDPEENNSFIRFAFPISDDVWMFRGNKAKSWIPIKHSCDPNAWIVGMDIVARREILQGEEITIEYATIMNESMPSFVCECQSDSCRKLIKGTDYLLPEMEMYNGHFSVYIKRKRHHFIMKNAEMLMMEDQSELYSENFEISSRDSFIPSNQKDNFGEFRE